MIIQYREEEQALTKSFSSPIINTGTPAKSNAYSATCDYIIRNFVVDLKLLDDNTLMLGNGLDGNQSDDKELNVKNMIDQPRIEGIPYGEPNSGKDMTRTHHSKINQDDVFGPGK